MREERELILELRGFPRGRTAIHRIQVRNRGADHHLRAVQLGNPGRIIKDGGRIVRFACERVRFTDRRRALVVEGKAAGEGLRAASKQEKKKRRGNTSQSFR